MKTFSHTQQLNQKELEERVKNMYRQVALFPNEEYHFEMGQTLALRLGYPKYILDYLPTESLASFAGVGYFFHLADLHGGEKIIDLGSGSGLDAFYAAFQVGAEGQVIGIDMTEAQYKQANFLRNKNNFANLHFIKGYIEEVPLPNQSIDVVISNGVINLSPDKGKVFKEAARILKPGGRMVLADIVSTIALPNKIRSNAALWAACIGGAIPLQDYTEHIEKAGFQIIIIEDNSQYYFKSDNARSACRKYGIKSISLLAIKK